MFKIFNVPASLITRHYKDNSPLPEYRSEFMRDRDRVLYCTAIRRLAGKTQIYTIGADDHKKNRLTHSLEVAQIARTICRGLGLNEDLAEAIALGHDIGHTPFGHAGEQMLNEIMIPDSSYLKCSPLYRQSERNIQKTLARESGHDDSELLVQQLFGFKHNIQSVRVAALLEDSYRNEKGENIGLNLTNYTLWGMQNHSRLLYDADSKYPNYQNRFKEFLLVKDGTAEAWSLEAYIVRYADDIAQWHHDMEDAIRGNAMSVEKICETIEKALGSQLEKSDSEVLKKNSEIMGEDRRCLAELSHIVVNALVCNIQEQSKRNMELIKDRLKKSFQEKSDDEVSVKLFTDYDSIKGVVGFERDGIIAFSPAIDTEQFKNTIKKSVHHSKEVERMNEKGKYIIRKIFEAYYSHPQQLPNGPIYHFMVDIGKYPNIEEAKKAGQGEVRIKFDEVLKNPKLKESIILMRRICDHIASMTDRYAIEEYNSLYG